MSFMNIDELSDRDLIAQYVVECRSKGLCLTYVEYELIDRWLAALHNDREGLLLILADILPAYFAKADPRRRAKPLGPLHKSVMGRIREWKGAPESPPQS